MNFGPFTRIITSSKVQVSAIAVITSALILFNVSPEKRDQSISLVTGILGLAGAIVLATGYEDGKEKEGTIPAGKAPANPPVPPVAINVGTAEPDPAPSTPPGTETTSVTATTTKTVPVADAADKPPAN
jgi:hypothetical protein